MYYLAAYGTPQTMVTLRTLRELEERDARHAREAREARDARRASRSNLVARLSASRIARLLSDTLDGLRPIAADASGSADPGHRDLPPAV